MANSSHIPIAGLREVRPDALHDRSLADHEDGNGGVHTSNGVANSNVFGPRKLVRPTLPVQAIKGRGFSSRGESPILAHHAAMTAAPSDCESSHAEAFYFQKQMQTQTLMAFVLEDGEQIEGYIEWYDRDVIKVRNGSRTLIYKSSIKYLHKVSELSGQ
jgi:sRNA-binding regulator protein Hfq